MRPLKRQDLAGKVESAPPKPPTGPCLVFDGPTLCWLHFWTEEEWAALPEQDRPTNFTHAPGRGWVGTLPIECMN
jgi:hypothetical protein